MITPELIHYLSAGICISLGSIGAGIGLGIAGKGSQDAMIRQPTGNKECSNALIIGIALIESGAIIALVVALLILFGRTDVITFEIAFIELCIGIAVGTAAAVISIASSLVVKAATQAISRQPFFAPKILTFMLISQSIIEAPALFVFIITIIIRSQITETLSLIECLKLCSSALVIGIGCIGPSLGQSIFADTACTAIGINKNAYDKLFPFTLINQAFIETPIIFCVVLSLLIVYSPLPTLSTLTDAVKYPIAAIALGIGTLGSGYGMGYVASRGCLQIALDPDLYGIMIRTTLMSLISIEASVIYALIIAMSLVM